MLWLINLHYIKYQANHLDMFLLIDKLTGITVQKYESLRLGKQKNKFDIKLELIMKYFHLSMHVYKGYAAD